LRDLRRWTRDAEMGDARLRLALRVVPRRADRDARLVSRETAGHRMSATGEGAEACASSSRTPGGPEARATTGESAAPSAPTRAEAFRYWLKLGFVSFGGPAG